STLMGPARLSDAPGSGAAGGLAYCLGAVGARLLPASAALNEISGYAQAVASAHVAVIVVDELTPSTLDHIAAPSAAAAAAHAVPSVVITSSLHVGKRDLLAAGVVSAYEAPVGLDGLSARIERIARTWTPPPRA
ncbi:MAG: glycerate kinase, partial [Demequina sp.]